ncbi:MAG: substrate-binding domain-containing protein, partial [Aequoribacter sp.]
LAGSNNLQGGRLAGEHIAKTGRKRIAFVGYQDHPEIASRFAGVQQGLAEHNLSISSELIFGSLMDRNTGEKSLEQLVNRRDEYDAVIAASDMQAFKVMSALQSVGVDIPRDVAVIGYDDIPAAAIYHPTLTTIRQDRSAGAELLVDNLLKVLDGKGPSCIELEPELIKRESA